IGMGHFQGASGSIRRAVAGQPCDLMHHAAQWAAGYPEARAPLLNQRSGQAVDEGELETLTCGWHFVGHDHHSPTTFTRISRDKGNKHKTIFLYPYSLLPFLLTGRFTSIDQPILCDIAPG